MPIPDDKYILIARRHKSTLAGHDVVQRTIYKLDTLGHQRRHRREHVKQIFRHCHFVKKYLILSKHIIS